MGVHLEMSKSEKPNWRNNGNSVLMKKKKVRKGERKDLLTSPAGLEQIKCN